MVIDSKIALAEFVVNSLNLRNVVLSDLLVWFQGINEQIGSGSGLIRKHFRWVYWREVDLAPVIHHGPVIVGGQEASVHRTLDFQIS